MGFKDGTNNIRAEDAEALDEFVWAGDEAPAWMRGGTYLVTPPDPDGDRELGPHRARRAGADDRPARSTRGAPLGGSDEFDHARPRARAGPTAR